MADTRRAHESRPAANGNEEPTMRILYQLTSPMHRTLGVQEIARRAAFLSAHAAAGTELSVEPTETGPAAIEGPADAALVVPELLRLVPLAGQNGFDAVIIGCFSDPGLDALRERSSIALIGPGASAMHLAAQLGSRFSILAPSGRREGQVRARLRALGLDALFASVRGVGCSVLELAQGANDAVARVAAAGRSCVEEDGAEVIVLGCMSMAFLPGAQAALQSALGCPVINPVIAALKTAEAFGALGVAHPAAA
jgi:allantoin racemase